MKIPALIVTLFITHGASHLVFSAGERVFIQSFGFDRQSKEFQISYSTSDSHSITTLKDSGALYLCVINRLLKEYYNRMSEARLDENRTEFTKSHLVLLNQIAATIPYNDGAQIRESLRRYIQNFHRGGGPVLQAIRDTISNVLKEHPISMIEETHFNPNHKQQLERKISFINSQLEELKKHQDSDNPDMKLLLIRSFEGKLIKLRNDLKTLPTQSSKKEKKVSALETIFCSSQSSGFILENPEIGMLIEKFSNEVKSALPKEQMSDSETAETHF